ncbi:hypothetical protein PHLCEN_2v3011 [Hermanssonia centrifuga]|uniref:Uncharacterized protein n=1 Tax=Hermanssonia centrifuga TaxID=98765 RepID=A0A2R6R799_9APHY|nr:hypothetical protein PHLCEN_2v3011 [Hermanssonia centrifuga]
MFRICSFEDPLYLRSHRLAGAAVYLSRLQADRQMPRCVSTTTCRIREFKVPNPDYSTRPPRQKTD